MRRAEEPASQPATRRAKGRPSTPVPTTETMMLPRVWAMVAVPAGDGPRRGPSVAHSEPRWDILGGRWLPRRRLYLGLARDSRFNDYEHRLE